MIPEIISYIFSQERLLTLFTIIIAIILYEILKKSVKKTVGYITQRKTKAGLVILFIVIIVMLVFLI